MKKHLFFIVATTIVFLNSIIAQTIPSYVPTNNLKAWFPFNGNANDESGQGNNGTSVGASLTTDRYSNANAAYFFNGSVEVDCGTALNIDESTISAWFYLSDNTSQYQTILAKYDANNTGSYALAMFGDKVDIWYSKTSTTYIDVQSTASLSINQWYNVTVTHSIPFGIKLYINGVLDNSDNTVFNVFQAPTDVFRIGSQGPFFPVQIQAGKIDDVAIWDRVLTPTEVSNLYLGTATSLLERKNSSSPSLFPNPCNGNFSIDLSTADVNTSKITIVNTYGEKVYEQNTASKNLDIDLSKQPKGLYFINFCGENGKITSQKVIIQ
ncbi:MAG: T9SS type A sorting domain-containing protein [Bacteroidia bacterium]|nr:T9SS type A sorting domain-containing protein [Bacteroidia bacterium]